MVAHVSSMDAKHVRRVTDVRVLGATVPAWKVAALLSLCLSNCGVTAPFERAPASVAASDAQITTGSIGPARAPAQPIPTPQLSPDLDQEDWRRASAALATALDPQGNGAPVRWENAQSGRKGSFSPVGDPFLVKDEICRGFVADLAAEGLQKALEGSACRSGPSNWTIRQATDRKRRS